MADTPSLDSLIDYPCDFPVKVMGKAHPDFANTMTRIIQEHDTAFDPSTVQMRASTGGKYVSLTFTILAVSRKQLDALYHDLSQHPMVSMVL